MASFVTTSAPPPSPFTPSPSKKRGADDMEEGDATTATANTPQSLYKRRWTDASFNANSANDGSMNEMIMGGAGGGGANDMHVFGNGMPDGGMQHPGARPQLSMPSFPGNPFMGQHNNSNLASPAISTFSTNDTASVYENGEHPFVFEHDSPDMRDEDVSFSSNDNYNTNGRSEQQMHYLQQQQMQMQQMQQHAQNPIEIQSLGPQHPLSGFYDSYNGHGHFYSNQEDYVDDEEADMMAARYTGNGEYDCYTQRLNNIMGHA